MEDNLMKLLNKEISTDLQRVSIPNLKFLSLKENPFQFVDDDRNIARLAPSNYGVLDEVVFLLVFVDLALKPSFSGVQLALKTVNFVDVLLVLDLHLDLDVLIFGLESLCQDLNIIYVSPLLQFHLKKLRSCLVVLLDLQSQLFLYCCIFLDISLEDIVERGTSFFICCGIWLGRGVQPFKSILFVFFLQCKQFLFIIFRGGHSFVFKFLAFLLKVLILLRRVIILQCSLEVAKGAIFVFKIELKLLELLRKPFDLQRLFHILLLTLEVQAHPIDLQRFSGLLLLEAFNLSIQFADNFLIVLESQPMLIIDRNDLILFFQNQFFVFLAVCHQKMVTFFESIVQDLVLLAQ